MNIQGNIDATELLKLLSMTLSMDGNVRESAEASLDEVPFAQKTTGMLQHLSQVTSPDLFQHILIYLRRLILNESNKTQSAIDPHTLSILKSLTLKVLSDSIYMKDNVKNKVVDLIITVFEAPTGDENDLEWTELAQFVVQSAQTNDPAYLDTFLKIVGSSPIILDKCFVELWPTIKTLVTNYLNPEQNNSVRALLAINTFVQLVEFYAPKPFSSLKPITELLLKDTLYYIHTPQAFEILRTLQETCQNSPKLFSSCLDSFCGVILTILGLPELEEDVRIMAVECFVELARSLRGAFKKRADSCAAFINYCITFIATLDNHDEWVDVDVIDHVDENTLSFSASVSLDRLAEALGGCVCIRVINAISQIPPDNWKVHAAVLIAITSICEGAKKRIVDYLQGIVTFVLQSLTCTQNPLLLNCAMNCIAELSANTKGNLMKLCHANVYNALLQVASQTAAVPRCQSKAYECISSVSENCPNSILTQYAGPIIENCLQSVKTSMEKFSATHQDTNRDRLVLNSCMLLFSTLAENLEDALMPYMQSIVSALLYMIQEFAKYQSPFEPHVLASLRNQQASSSDPASNSGVSFHHLTRVFQGQNDSQHFYHLSILLESLKTITQIHFSVHELDSGPQEYVHPILEILKSINIDAELHVAGQEHLKNSYFDVISNICTIFGDVSSTLLPVFMPLLLNAAAIHPDIQIYDKEAADADDVDDDLYEDIPLGYKEVLRLRTDQLEDKESACSILAYVMDNVTVGLAPYVEPILTLIVSDLLKYALSSDVRISAIEMVKPLLKVASRESPQLFQSVWEKVNPLLITSISTEKNNDVLKVFADAIEDILVMLGSTCLSQEQLVFVSAALAKRVKEIIQYLEQETKTLGHKNSQPEEDPEEQQLLDEDDERMDRICILHSVQIIQISFFKLFRDQFYAVSCADQIPLALDLCKASNLPTCASEVYLVLLESALITISNIIEYCNPSIFVQDPTNFLTPFIQFLPGGQNHQICIQAPSDPKSQALSDCKFRWSIVQIVCFSLGLASERASQSGLPLNSIEPYVRAASRTMIQFLSLISYNPYCPPNESCIASIENVVCAVGRIIRYTPSLCEPTPEAGLQVWSSYLPLLEDEQTEALTFYIQLFKQNPGSFLGANMEHFDAVLKKIVLMAEYVESDLNDVAVEVLHQLNQQYSQKYNEIVSAWEPIHVESLKYAYERYTKNNPR